MSFACAYWRGRSSASNATPAPRRAAPQLAHLQRAFGRRAARRSSRSTARRWTRCTAASLLEQARPPRAPAAREPQAAAGARRASARRDAGARAGLRRAQPLPTSRAASRTSACLHQQQRHSSRRWRRAPRTISAKLEPRHAANLAWAYASVGVSSSPMVDAISMVIRRPAAEFNAQELVMATAALGRLTARSGGSAGGDGGSSARSSGWRAPRGRLGELRLLDLDELCGAYAPLGLAGWGARLTAAAAAAGAAACAATARRRRCAASPTCCGRWRGSRRRTSSPRAAWRRSATWWRSPRRRSASSLRARRVQRARLRECGVGLCQPRPH